MCTPQCASFWAKRLWIWRRSSAPGSLGKRPGWTILWVCLNLLSQPTERHRTAIRKAKNSFNTSKTIENIIESNHLFHYALVRTVVVINFQSHALQSVFILPKKLPLFEHTCKGTTTASTFTWSVHLIGVLSCGLVHYGEWIYAFPQIILYFK